MTFVLFEFDDFPMMRRLVLGIRWRAEQLARQHMAAMSP